MRCTSPTNKTFDLALIDRMLPEMEGSRGPAATRAAQIETPVLLLTALGRIEDRVEGLEAGADDYLVKPFAFSELAARINALAPPQDRNSQATRFEYAVAVDGLAASARCGATA